jgi:hypothetical protein
MPRRKKKLSFLIDNINSEGERRLFVYANAVMGGLGGDPMTAFFIASADGIPLAVFDDELYMGIDDAIRWTAEECRASPRFAAEAFMIKRKVFSGRNLLARLKEIKERWLRDPDADDYNLSPLE